MAGNREAVTFTSEALDLIHASTKGIPRLVNIICDFLLISAFADQLNVIEDALVTDITGDLDFDRHFWGKEAELPEPPPARVLHAQPQSDSGELLSALRHITSRLDVMEKDSRRLSESIHMEFVQKLADLQSAFISHVRETDAILLNLKGSIEKLAAAAESSKKDTIFSARNGIIRSASGS